jgi:hypothetical protein
MNIINEVDSHTNLELKNEYEEIKVVLDKVKSERDNFYQDLKSITLKYHDLDGNY